MRRNSEKGQAIIEFTIALIGIMAVFLGVIFAFALGKSNVENIIECRGMADSYAGNGVTGGYGNVILSWEEGNDGRMYTNDDEYVSGVVEDPQLFIDELNNPVDLISLNPDYMEHNFTNRMDGMYSLFLSMANMTSYSVITDPYENETIDDLKGAFNSIIYDSDLTIENSVYMPIFYIEE